MPKPFFVEAENGRIAHRAEIVMLGLSLLVIPAIVLEQNITDVRLYTKGPLGSL